VRLIVKPTRDIIERIGPVNLRLSHPEQVEVGAIEDEDEGLVAKAFLAVR
jgi:hypothetical protein